MALPTLTGATIDLTKVVRPFTGIPISTPTRTRTERGFYFGSPSYVAPGTTTDPGNPPPEGLLRWSASQSVGVTTLGAMGFTINWPDDPNNDYAETLRTTHTVRVENPDDSSQFVDVERIDTISFRNGQKIPYDYSLNNA